MPKCRDCIHDKVCSEYFHAFWGHTANKHSDLINADPKDCPYFKDRSRFVELPCKVGDTVYAYWDMDNPCSNYLHVIEDFIIDLVILVDRKNSVIGFRAGRTCEQNGRKCDIEFDLKDIGKTVFLTREEAEQALKLKERENDA